MLCENIADASAKLKLDINTTTYGPNGLDVLLLASECSVKINNMDEFGSGIKPSLCRCYGIF